MAAATDVMRALAWEAQRVADDQDGVDAEFSRRVAARMRDSVIRPLGGGQEDDAAVAADHQATDDAATDAAPLAEAVWALARQATLARVEHPHDVRLGEATAALQDLALQLADEVTAQDRLAEFERLQAGLEPAIQVAPQGPYVVTNARKLTDWLGQTLPTRPQMALCRCGQSQMKPFCDGSHVTSGFTDAKDPNRVADQVDTYVGQQVTILDNRGTCQHAGLCTDRLATVFRVKEEPFVTPSGGRMDEIIRAVRACPSGALSYATDGVEARAGVDHHGKREQTIEVSKDGPYRITGGVPFVDADGADVPRNAGASHEHYALCRCGHSQNKPFCSGMHWYVEFHDPVIGDEGIPTIFEWAGGVPALLRMTRIFYEKLVPEDSLLAPVFANMSADHPERVASWLAEVFCGPKNYSSQYGGYVRMISQHLGKCITEEQRTRWVALILQAAREANLPNDPEFRSVLGAYVEWASRLAVENSQITSKPPEHMPMPHWDWNTSAGPPGARVSALVPEVVEDVPVALPPPG